MALQTSSFNPSSSTTAPTSNTFPVKNVIVWAGPDSPLHNSPLLKILKQNPFRYEETSWSHSFPLLTDIDVQQSFGRKGSMFGRQIQASMFWDKVDKKLIGCIHFPRDCEGPPNKVHGGALATMLDMLFGWHSIRVLGLGCVTLTLNVNYHHFVPLGGVVRFEIETEKQDGRKLFMRGKLTNNIYTVEDNEQVVVHNTADALFIQHKDSKMSYDEAVKLFGAQSSLTKEQVIRHFKSVKGSRLSQAQNNTNSRNTQNKSDVTLQSKL